MGREENVIIFQDTESLARSNARLLLAVKESTANQKLILEQEQVCDVFGKADLKRNRYKDKAKVVVSKKRSFEAASAYTGDKICVHNFASATTPGGGVVKGSSAQEECLCRCSTLYFSLNTPAMWDGFYTPHRAAQDPVHNDDCIYTPGVVVMKSDTASPVLMLEEEWFAVDVITCAAPNLRLMPSNQMNPGDGNKRAKLSEEDLRKLHEKRWTRILDVALAAEDDVVILGAFGCGAFENNPEVVAQAARTVIENYLHSFKTIEFAVYCSPRDETNYQIFQKTMSTL